MSTVANVSFLSSFDELFYYTEKKIIYQALTEEYTDEEDNISNDLPTGQDDRLITMMNWGKDFITSILRERYNFSTITASNAPIMLKEWNARLVMWKLLNRRLRSTEAPTENLEEIRDEIAQYALEKTVFSLDLPRIGAAIETARDSKATAFDSSGQFNDIIPSAEYDDIWPGGLND